MTKVFPRIGMGTFGSDRYDGATVSAAVAEALRAGYRLFDEVVRSDGDALEKIRALTGGGDDGPA